MSFFRLISLQISALGKFWQEKINNQIFWWNIILIGSQIAFLIFKFNSLPDQVPLYYSQPWGEDQLAHASALFLLPTFSIIIVLINNLLATIFLNRIQLLSRLLVVFSLVFSFLSLVTLFQIINLIS
ncbi:MAG: hypothetical protein WCG91_01255 [Candidatus Shapirobacteria bacterium]